jgi:hypothetical protein
MLETPGPTPSQGAKSTGYPAIQSHDALVIYDGRWASERIRPTIAPPIQLYHPVFAEFINLVNTPDTEPSPEDFENVYKLMCYLSQLGRKEVDYSHGLSKHLTTILKRGVFGDPNPDGTRPDGVISLQIDNTRFPILLMEVKRELGEVSDPSTQVSLSMRRSWIDSEVGYKHIHLDLMADSSIEKKHSRKVLLPNIFDRCRGTMAQYSG